MGIHRKIKTWLEKEKRTKGSYIFITGNAAEVSHLLCHASLYLQELGESVDQPFMSSDPTRIPWKYLSPLSHETVVEEETWGQHPASVENLMHMTVVLGS